MKEGKTGYYFIAYTKSPKGEKLNLKKMCRRIS